MRIRVALYEMEVLARRSAMEGNDDGYYLVFTASSVYNRVRQRAVNPVEKYPSWRVESVGAGRWFSVSSGRRPL